MTTTSFERPPEETDRLARWAGAAYLALGVASLCGFFHAPLVRDDINALARAITGPGFRFRVGVVADVLTAVLSVPVSLLLYQLLKVVHQTQATLMALLLLLATPVSFVVALNYVAAQMLLSGTADMSAFTEAQRGALGMLFLRLHAHGVVAVEIFWGLWLLPFGLLVMRSRFLPRVLGILLFIAGLAYVAHSATTLLLAGQRFVLYERVTMLARAAGEFPIILWLLIKGASWGHARSASA
jgi:hypothetical protein